jgi:hypothetical protein
MMVVREAEVLGALTAEDVVEWVSRHASDRGARPGEERPA